MSGAAVNEAAFPQIPLEFGIFDWIEWGEAPLNEVFEAKLKLIEHAEQLGFACYHVAEHHGTPLSINGSPGLFLAAAAQRTERIRLSPLTYCLPWHNPYRLYNEICMLDQLSKGRLEIGVSRGVSPIEARIYGIQSVEQSREMSQEALDVLLAAFNNNELNYEGKHYQFENVELWNRPYQLPYPPLWFPSSNESTVPFIAKHGFHTSHNFAPVQLASLHFAHYKEAWLHHKDEPDRMNGHVAVPKLTNSRHVYVAPTDAQAMEEVREPFLTWRQHITHLNRRVRGEPDVGGELEMASRLEQETLIVGSPETVTARITEAMEISGINYFLGVFAFGNMAQDKAKRSMDLFAQEVMPAVRAQLN